MESYKPKVFVIIPFDEDFLELYEELKNQFGEFYEFLNAGDMDNQQNILRDIVEGIAWADVIIADLSGLNANVFYELGLAHAMGKKVIIITQDLEELPFDIRSYRANQYSTKFYKIPLLFSELEKLLAGAIDGSIRYGSPVSDFSPSFQNVTTEKHIDSTEIGIATETEKEEAQEDGDKGFLDYIADINENSQTMNQEIEEMSAELIEMGQSVNGTTEKINRANEQTGKVDPNFLRNICRKLSEPVGTCAENLKEHIDAIAFCWSEIDNSYLGLLDNPFFRRPENIDELKKTKAILLETKVAITNSNAQIAMVMESSRGCLGIEKRLNKAINELNNMLQDYLTMTGTVFSSIDRIVSKSDMVIDALQ